MTGFTYTRCPGCATVFRVTAEQLALREGQVRCGRCRAVFDANNHVVAREAWSPAVADTAAEGPSTERPAPASPETAQETPAAELAPVDVTVPSTADATEKTVFGGAAEAVAEALHEAQRRAPPTEDLAVEPAPGDAATETAGTEGQAPGDAAAAAVGTAATVPTDHAAAPSPPTEADVGDATAVAPVHVDAPPPAVGPGVGDAAAVATDHANAPSSTVERDAATLPDRPIRYQWKPRKRLRERPNALYAVALGVLLVGLPLQAVYGYRDLLAARVPFTRPLLQAACDVLGCVIEPLRDTAALSIEASDLQADPAHRGLLLLTATIRNRAAYALAYPHLELTLTDASDRVVARRSFAPTEYAGGTANLGTGIPANGEKVVKLFLDASSTSQAGYRLYLFYP